MGSRAEAIKKRPNALHKRAAMEDECYRDKTERRGQVLGGETRFMRVKGVQGVKRLAGVGQELGE